MSNITFVSAFFDIDRDKWTHYGRTIEEYMDESARVMTLNNNFVIFTEKKFYDKIMHHRRSYMDKTTIILTDISSLPYYRYFDDISNIMNNSNFRKGLKNDVVPEVTKPLYLILIWSKIYFVTDAIKKNIYNTVHFGWIDFGLHKHILQDKYINTELFHGVNICDRIKLMCRSEPQTSDLNIDKFYKSHINRFASGLITGNIKFFKLFEEHIDNEIKICLQKKIVDCEQSIYTVIYLKHPEIFNIYHGDWSDIVNNYIK